MASIGEQIPREGVQLKTPCRGGALYTIQKHTYILCTVCMNMCIYVRVVKIDHFCLY